MRAQCDHHPRYADIRVCVFFVFVSVNPLLLWILLRFFVLLLFRLGVALELTPDLPDNPLELARWEGEPVQVWYSFLSPSLLGWTYLNRSICGCGHYGTQALIFPTDIFLTNKKGYPCLSKAHQEFVVNMYRVMHALAWPCLYNLGAEPHLILTHFCSLTRRFWWKADQDTKIPTCRTFNTWIT